MQGRYTNAATLYARITAWVFKCSKADSLKTNALGPCIRTLTVLAGHDQPHTGPPWISPAHGAGVPFKSSALRLQPLLKWHRKVYPPLALVLAFVLVSKATVPCWGHLYFPACTFPSGVNCPWCSLTSCLSLIPIKYNTIFFQCMQFICTWFSASYCNQSKGLNFYLSILKILNLTLFSKDTNHTCC